MQVLVDRIVSSVGIDEDLARRSIGIVLNFLKSEAPPEVVDKLIAELPGAETVLAEPEQKPGGVMGMVSGLLGKGMGGALATFTLLTEAGLDMGQVQSVLREIIGFAREKAGDEAVDEVVLSIPGLAQFVG